MQGNRATVAHVALERNGSLLQSYAYTPNGQRSTRADESGSYALNYDSRDRVIAAFGPVGTLHYAYDQAGNLTNLQSSTINGVWLNYEYDALNRVTNVIDKRLTGTNNTRYGFDAIGNLIALAYPNGVTNLWQYDTRNRLTNEIWKLNTTMLGSFYYQLGVAGNRTNLTDGVNGSARTYAWQYDNLYRLTNEVISGSAPGGAVAYRYDVVGNRTNRNSTIGGITNQTFSYTTNDWLTSDGYDQNGNTTNSAGATYRYDWANRLTNFVNGTTNVSIVYDADGNRVSKTVNGVTTLYLVDVQNPTGYSQVLDELTVSGQTTNLTRVYSYGLDLLSQRHSSGTLHFYGYDGLGSVRFLADTVGVITDTYAYDAYGTLIATTGTNWNPYLFAGEEYDLQIVVYWLRARLSNPNMGRFLTSDPFEGHSGDPLSLHKYLYAHSDPVNRIDPSGNFSLLELNITTGQMLLVGYKVANATANAYFGARNIIDGATALHRGETFSGALQVLMGAINIGSSFLSVMGPLPPPPPALVVVSGPGLTAVERAILLLNNNPALRDWFLTHVLPQLASTATAAAGYAVNSVAAGGGLGGSTPPDPIRGHHALPKFLGGDEAQILAFVPLSVHKAFHSLLARYLKEAGFERAIGGATGSARHWYADFAANPGAQDRALVEVFRASREIDMKHGTTITQTLWDNLMQGYYKSIP